MKDYARLAELNSKLDGFMFNHAVELAVAFAFIMVFIYLFSESEVAAITGFFATIIAVVVIVLVDVEEVKIRDEIAELEVSLDLKKFKEREVVTATKIIEKIPVDEEYCHQVELKEGDLCTYVEFVSSGEVSQVFIPTNKPLYADKENPLEIKYIKFAKEDTATLYEHYRFDTVLIDGKHKIYPNSWGLAVSVQ